MKFFLYISLSIILEVLAVSLGKSANNIVKLLSYSMFLLSPMFFIISLQEKISHSTAYIIWSIFSMLLVYICDVIFFAEKLKVLSSFGLLVMILGMVIFLITKKTQC